MLPKTWSGEGLISPFVSYYGKIGSQLVTEAFLFSINPLDRIAKGPIARFRTGFACYNVANACCSTQSQDDLEGEDEEITLLMTHRHGFTFTLGSTGHSLVKRLKSNNVRRTK